MGIGFNLFNRSEKRIPVMASQSPDIVKVDKPQPKSSKEQFEKQLEQGMYLGILESYKVAWYIEKVARDTLQNFFDAAGGTLDGVDFKIEEIKQDGGESKYKIRIEGSSSYDYRKLLHIGGTGKDDNTTVGGFGEGTKIIPLALIRDFKAEDIKFGADNWETQFYLESVPAGSYDEPVRGLYANKKSVSPIAGNYFEATLSNRQEAEAFIKAKELFYHSENLDFKDPTFESDAGGFKFLGSKEKGHLYDAGQRRHFENADTGWDKVEGVNIWSKYKKFGTDRDRGSVSRYEVKDKVVKDIIRSADENALRKILSDMESVWPSGSNWSHEVSYYLLFEAVSRMKELELKMEFDDKYLAASTFMPTAITEALVAEGYVICQYFFEKIGMKTAKERFKEMQTHFRVEPAPEQNRRHDLLYDAVEQIKKIFDANNEGKEIKPKNIWMFSRQDEKNIIQGQYNEDYVWISEEIIEGKFAKALATYLHELDHKFGSDQSAEFSYALTDTLELVIEAITQNPDKFAKLQSEWEKRTPYEKI